MDGTTCRPHLHPAVSSSILTQSPEYGLAARPQLPLIPTPVDDRKQRHDISVVVLSLSAPIHPKLPSEVG